MIKSTVPHADIPRTDPTEVDAQQREVLRRQLAAAAATLIKLERESTMIDIAVSEARARLRMRRDEQFKNIEDRTHLRFRVSELTRLLAALPE